MGSGYRVFTAGEVLTASNVQDYLQNQSVMSFADSTARATSIGTANFEEGMVSYLQDSDTLEVYDGSTWGSIAPATTQGLTLINTTSFSGVSSQSVNDVFSTTYDNYRIYFQNLTNSSSGDIRLRWRVSGADNTTTNYKSAGQQNGTDNSTASVGQTSQTSIRIGYFTSGSNNFLTGIDVLNPFLTFPTGTFNSAFDGGGAGFSTVTTSLFNATTSFTGFTVFPASGNISGSVSVYGFNK